MSNLDADIRLKLLELVSYAFLFPKLRKGSVYELTIKVLNLRHYCSGRLQVT